ncbi:putative smile protein-like protein, partial [Leptotrombidium deliense]
MCAFDSNYCICLTRTWIQLKSGCGFGQQQTDHNENLRRFVDANTKCEDKNSTQFNEKNVDEYRTRNAYLTRITRQIAFLLNRFVYITRRFLESNKKCIVTHLILFIASFACFSNSLNGEFVHDDLVAIIGNKDVCRGQNSLLDVFNNDFWGKPMADGDSHKSYRPLTVLSFR